MVTVDMTRNDAKRKGGMLKCVAKRHAIGANTSALYGISGLH